MRLIFIPLFHPGLKAGGYSYLTPSESLPHKSPFTEDFARSTLISNSLRRETAPNFQGLTPFPILGKGWGWGFQTHTLLNQSGQPSVRLPQRSVRFPLLLKYPFLLL